jgi:hypothetical protein
MVLRAVVSAVALIALLTPVGVSANNDPHRTFLAATPLDLPAGFCSFPVHLDFPVNKEYGTISTTADGSTMIKVTGSLVVTATNTTRGTTITLNVSGPGTNIISPDGTKLQFDFLGLTLFFVTNGPQFGLPSGLVQTSGPLTGTLDPGSSAIISLTSRPHVLLDVCAALA